MSEDEELRRVAELEEKYERDIKNIRESGKIDGKTEGKKEGRLEGKLEEKKEIAKKLKGIGMTIKEIKEITGLSEDDIKNIK